MILKPIKKEELQYIGKTKKSKDLTKKKTGIKFHIDLMSILIGKFQNSTRNFLKI